MYGWGFLKEGENQKAVYRIYFIKWEEHEVVKYQAIVFYIYTLTLTTYIRFLSPM